MDSTASRTACGFVKSTGRGLKLGCGKSSCETLLDEPMTLAPAERKRWVTKDPRPPFAPVIRTTLSRMSFPSLRWCLLAQRYERCGTGKSFTQPKLREMPSRQRAAQVHSCKFVELVFQAGTSVEVLHGNGRAVAFHFGIADSGRILTVNADRVGSRLGLMRTMNLPEPVQTPYRWIYNRSVTDLAPLRCCTGVRKAR